MSLLDIPTESSGLQTFAIFLVFFLPAVALVVIIARNAGRLAANQFGLDDWLVSVAMFLSIIETFFSYFYIKSDFIGIHMDDVPPHDRTNAMIWQYAVQIPYNPILALTKSSVLIFLQRLFGQRTGTRSLILSLNIVNMSHMVAILFAITLQCRPIAFNWDTSIPDGQCVHQSLLYISTASFNILTDLVVLGLPLFILADLKIPKRTKVGLMFVFLLGILVTITSIARLVILTRGSFRLDQSRDTTFNIGFVTSAIETNLALITASVPALRPFLRSRDRGGWLPTLGVRSPDTEMGQKATAHMSRLSRASTAVGTATATVTATVSGSGKKWSFGSGSRGGRTGSRRGGGGRSGSRHEARRAEIRIAIPRRELHSQTPRTSEEEAMTGNGIMRVSDIHREIDGLARDMRGQGFLATDPSDLSDAEYRGERDFHEERLSRYGERRFGVVTAQSTTPRWTDGSGSQPF